MTRINKLILHGFKSFAKYTDLEFGEHYNCVLGPNGSGKSNILDALTFVLGKAGSKSMRAEKSANLIYNGGRSKKPAKKGEVSIIFDNKDKSFPTEDSEVKVTRIINSNGQSIYKINDQPRTRQQILDLLNIAKIDPDGYNIILQGDIVRFCDMSTIERRMLLEEISGISVYEEKKQKAVSHLEKVGERLKEAEIVLSERGSYMKDLKKDRDQALKFRELADNVKRYKASLLKIQIEKAETEQRLLKEKIQKNDEAQKDAQTKIDEIKAAIQKKKSEIESITKEIEQKGELEQVNLNREIEQIKIEMTKKSARIENIAADQKKLQAREADIAANVSSINEKVQGLEKQKKDFLERGTSIEKERQGMLAKLASFRQKHNIQSAGDLEKRIDQIDVEADEISRKVHTLREKQHNLLREKDRIDHEKNSIRHAIEKLAELEKEHKQQLDALRELRSEFKKVTLELNKCLDEDAHLTAKANDTRSKLHQISEELAKKQARSASMKEISLGDKAVQAVIASKRAGIYGTVSDLGSVDAKYSLALEVAAGNRLKSVVVENDAIAAEQIKYLRSQRLGTASFIPLNKIKPKGMDEQSKGYLDAKGCHGCASDLVHYDAKFKKVFSYLFGDVLIVDTIDVARRLGIGSAKMVTLDGDMAEVSGVMKGGFRDKKRKGLGFSELQLDKEIGALESSSMEYSENLSSYESSRKKLEEQIGLFRAKKAGLEGEIIKSEKSLHLEAGDASSSKEREKALKEEGDAVEKEINRLQDEIAEDNRKLARLKIEKQDLKGKVSQIRNPTLLAEFAAYEENQQKLHGEFLGISAEIKNIEIQINDIFLVEKRKASEQLQVIRQEKESFSGESRIISETLGHGKQVLEKKELEARKFYSQFKEMFHKRSALSDVINKDETQAALLSEKAREIEMRNNALSIKNAEISATLLGLSQDFAQYEGISLDKEKDEEQLKYQLVKFERMKEEIGTVNMRALEIYGEIEKEYNKLLEKKETLAREKADVESLMSEIESKKTELFMKTYQSINEEFNRIFVKLSTKGEAFLDLENPENPFTEGVRIKVRISGQKFLDIRSLSGGEKTMTALAFIFAIQEHDSASFYILDEVDAALDKHNSEKLGKLIRSYSSRAQYIIISHNDSIISEADNLYGISMDENGMSKVVTLRI